MSAGPGTAPRVRSCGDSGVLLDLAGNTEVHRWAAAVREAGLTGVEEVVPGLTTLLLGIDPDATSVASVRAAIADLRPGATDLAETRARTVEVRYDGEDLDAVCEMTGLSRPEVVAAHTGTPWRVAFCGFSPGFSYLVGGNPRLEVPRRKEARVRVPAGAVALAGPFASVYPRVSPGGWQLIGHTDAVLWDTDADPPALLTPGTTVHFVEAPA